MVVLSRLMVDRSASPYAGLRSASVGQTTRNANHQITNAHSKAKPPNRPFPTPRSGFVQPCAAAPGYCAPVAIPRLAGRVSRHCGIGSLGGTTRMEIPEQFKDYDCRDYFNSDKFTRG